MKTAPLHQCDAEHAQRRVMCTILYGLLVTALPWLALGCGSEGTSRNLVHSAPPMLGKAATPSRTRGSDSHPAVVQVVHTDAMLPAPIAEESQAKVVPISLDTVLRLAEEQNPQLALGRERVCQAMADREIADKAWLPDLFVGATWRRHEGGIQNEDGTEIQSSFGSLFGGLEISGQLDLREATYRKVVAERELWQQRGELSKITHEKLLESATTYVDLLTARTAEFYAHDISEKLETLYKRAKSLSEDEPAARAAAEGLSVALRAHEQATLKFKQQGDAASAKLAYLLGLDMHTELIPVDDHLTTFELVDAGVPTEALVQTALTSGPGVQEVEGLLAVIQTALDRASGPGKYMPIVELRMLEGGFGAGPGTTLDWANRWDLGLAARWNLTEYLTAKERSRSALSRMHQAQLTLQDLQGRLTLGVREAHGAIQSGQIQIQKAREAVQYAREAYSKSMERLKDKAKGATHTEVFQAVRGYELAVAAWVLSVNDYDKAQLRLRLLVGPGCTQ